MNVSSLTGVSSDGSTIAPAKSSSDILENKKDVVDSGKKRGILHCYLRSDGEWTSKMFGADVDSVAVGPKSPATDVEIIGDDLDNPQLICKNFNGSWYLMETGKTDMMKVNGIPARQAVLPLNESAVVTLGDNKLVFIHSESEGGKPNLSTGVPGPSEFYFEDDKGNQYPFDPERACLIGANGFCDFCTGVPFFLTHIARPPDRSVFEQGFLGVFFKIKSTLMFSSIHDRLKLNGHATSTPHPVPDGSELTCGRTVIKLNVPKALTSAGRVLVPSRVSKTALALLPVSNPSGALPEIVIPHSASSITIGRSSQQADAVIMEPVLSRKHAQCVIYPKSIMIFDCGSSNGTFVNGERITKKTIHPGDVVSFGDIDYFFCYA